MRPASLRFSILLSAVLLCLLTGTSLAQTVPVEASVPPTATTEGATPDEPVADELGNSVATETAAGGETIPEVPPVSVPASSTNSTTSSENLNLLHLEDVLRLALERNRTIIGSRQQIETAEGQVAQARAISSPKLTGKFTQTRLDDVGTANLGGKTIAMGKKDVQKAYVELAQPLFLGGKDRATIAAARLGRSAARSGHTFTRQQVLQKTTMTWLAWLFAREVEQVSRKDLDLAEAHHKLVEARVRQEQASKFELLRAEVRLAQARSKFRQERNSVDLTRLDLLRILALPADLPIDTQDRLVMQEFPTDLASDASEAVELREDLRLKRLEAQIAHQGLRSARGEKQPTLNMFGQTGTEDPSSKSGLGGLQRKSYWNAGLVFEVPLVDGGLRHGKIQEASARVAIAENALQEALEKAQIEIRQSLLSLQTAHEVVLAQQEALKQAEEALRLAGVKYSNGMFTQVEMFDAENAFLNTNLQYLQAVFAHHQARVSYLLATGKLGRDLLDQPIAH